MPTRARSFRCRSLPGTGTTLNIILEHSAATQPRTTALATEVSRVISTRTPGTVSSYVKPNLTNSVAHCKGAKRPIYALVASAGASKPKRAVAVTGGAGLVSLRGGNGRHTCTSAVWISPCCLTLCFSSELCAQKLIHHIESRCLTCAPAATNMKPTMEKTPR